MVEDIKKVERLEIGGIKQCSGPGEDRGGPPIKPPPFAELVLNVIGDQSDAAHRIEGSSY